MPHTVTQQTDQEVTFPLQAGVDGFLRVDSTRIPKQGVNLPSQADIEVKPETTTTAQVAAFQEFARTPKNRQQQGVLGWNTSKTRCLTQEGDGPSIPFCREVDGYFIYLYLLVFFCFLPAKNSRVYQAGTRGEENFPSSLG